MIVYLIADMASIQGTAKTQALIDKKLDVLVAEFKHQESAQFLMMELIGYLEALMDMELITPHQFIKNIRKFELIQRQ